MHTATDPTTGINIDHRHGRDLIASPGAAFPPTDTAAQVRAITDPMMSAHTPHTQSKLNYYYHHLCHHPNRALHGFYCVQR